MTVPDSGIEPRLSGRAHLGGRTATWVARFRAPRFTFPIHAAGNPDRCLYSGNATGRTELYTLQRSTGEHRQVTSRPSGTAIGALDATGDWVWWLDDTDGDGWGCWMRQPFGGGRPEPAAVGLPPAYSCGLALGTRVTAVGLASSAGSTVYLIKDGYSSIVHSDDAQALVVGLSPDEDLLAIARASGEPGRVEVDVIDVETRELLAKFRDPGGAPIVPCGFSPEGRDPRVLLRRDTAEGIELLLWEPRPDRLRQRRVMLTGRVEATWYGDGSAVLLTRDHNFRTELYRLSPQVVQPTRIDTPPGTITTASAPGGQGSVEYLWSTAGSPPELRDETGAVLMRTLAPPAVQATDLAVQTPHGTLRALLCCPEHLLPPYAVVFLIPDDPAQPLQDAYSARRAAWVDAGYAVAEVDGAGWVGASPIGSALADIGAVSDQLAGRFLVDPRRQILAGRRWGGTLALAGLAGRQRRWAMGIAAAPIVEPALAELHAPVLLLAPTDDASYPLAALKEFAGELGKRNVAHEVVEYGSTLEDQIAELAVEIGSATARVIP